MMTRAMYSRLSNLVFIALAFRLSACSSNLFAATDDMQETLLTEGIALEDARFVMLLQQRQLEAAIAQHSDLLAAATQLAGHDVLEAFLSLSRLTNIAWYVPRKNWRRSAFSTLRAAFASHSPTKWWPVDSDVAGAAAGICKLQQVYDISATKMAAMMSHLLPSATAEDFKDVARGCFTNGCFGNTSAWSRAALERTSVISGTSRRLQLGLRWLRDSDDRGPSLQRSTRSRHSLHYPSPPQSDVEHYKSVCTAEGHLRSSSGQLFCTMATNLGDPRLLLAPQKIEVLSLQPRIVILPEFLSSSEVNYIRAATQRRFKRAEVYEPTKRASSETWKRIGKVSWLHDTRHPALQRLTRRIAAVTNLSMESAEDYQVANYGLGGHYTPHMDAHRFDKVASKYDANNGNRLATMLMYLTDVAAGGATAFTKLGIAVKPRVGDALFWYDVKPYVGSEGPQSFSFWHQKRIADELTHHVGCPVLWGSKLIVTKWIRERNNVVVRYNTPGGREA